MRLRIRGDRAGRLRSRASLIAVLAGFGLLATACGGSPSASVANLSPSSTTTTPPAANSGSFGSGVGSGGSPAASGGEQQTQIGIGGVSVQFAGCMRSHGVLNFPDPNGQGQVQLSGVNPQSSAFEAAQRACAKYGPNGGKPPSPAQQQRAVTQALKFSECMRSHGITNFPDPQVSTSGGGVRIGISLKGGPGSDLDPNNPRFQAAQKVCQPLMAFGNAKTGATATKS